MGVVPFQKDPDDRDRWSFDDSENDGAGKMSFLEHLDELRTRLMYALISLGAGALIAFLFIQRLYEFVMRPMQQMLPPGGRLIYTEAAEAFMLYIRIGIIAGLIIASPLILWQVWLFIAPALYAKERRFAIPFVLFASIFCVSGAAFGHYVVFPIMWKFFATFQNDFVTFTPRVETAFGLYIKMVVGMAIVFQMPTLVFFLAKMGVITARWMLRYFKYAILVIFIIAAVITPSPDVASQMIVGIPMIGLYILSIGIAWMFGKKRKPIEEV
ncbi:MAG: twin-arginine translocase subunit TatC [Vicinamibacterales bacterium]|nr:twin-arginine translocase subunit TatC [Vicinamibacterales bacterium]